MGGSGEKITAIMAYQIKKEWRKRNPLYAIWSEMIARCNNPDHRVYQRYGGRGIRVCRRWQGRNGYRNFCNDMGERPSNAHSLERNRNNAGYTPSNCVWATRNKQNRNRRNTRMLTYNGIAKPAMEWAEEHGVSRGLLYNRLKLGWPVERILTSPVTEKTGPKAEKGKLLTFDGKTQNIAAWAKEYGINYDALVQRVNKLGWSVKQALTTPMRKNS